MIRELAVPQTFTSIHGACGPACIRAILKYYGLHATDAAIAARAGRKLTDGMTLAQLQEAANSYGIEPWLVERASARMIADASDEGHPVLAVVCVDVGEGVRDMHGVVVTSVDDRDVIYMDPRGYRVVRTLAAWSKLRLRPDRDVDVLVFPSALVRVRDLPKRIRRET